MILLTLELLNTTDELATIEAAKLGYLLTLLPVDQELVARVISHLLRRTGRAFVSC